ncbi:MAG: hypothetical protein PHP00_06780 [Thiotrichaceae bacterium]|nr:hypothetical protein [Thiotrichaceae bacterium]
MVCLNPAHPNKDMGWTVFVVINDADYVAREHLSVFAVMVAGTHPDN